MLRGSFPVQSQLDECFINAQIFSSIGRGEVVLKASISVYVRQDLILSMLMCCLAGKSANLFLGQPSSGILDVSGYLK